MNDLERHIAELQAHTRRRAMKTLVIAGGALVLLGIALFVVGLTEVPPEARELVASRPMPVGFHRLLSGGGVLVAIIGFVMLFRAARVERG